MIIFKHTTLRKIKKILDYSLTLGYKIGLKKVIYALAILDQTIIKIGISGFIANFLFYRNDKKMAETILEKGILKGVENPYRFINYTSTKPVKKIHKVDLVEVLRCFYRATSLSGFKPFLVFGSLLGYVREGEFISWDKDLDIGFFYEEINIQQLIDRLEKNNFTIVINTGTDYPCRLKCRLGFSPLIDITFFKKEGDHLVTFTEFKGNFLYRKRTPFKIIETNFYDVSIWIPENPRLFLKENYGDWSTPKQIYHHILDSELTDYNDSNVQYLAKRTFFNYLLNQNKEHINHYLALFLKKMPEEEYWKKIKNQLDVKSNLF